MGQVLRIFPLTERERLLRDIERLTVERSKRYQVVEDAKRALLSCGHELQRAYIELASLAERGRRERTPKTEG